MEKLKDFTIIFAEDDPLVYNTFTRLLKFFFKEVYHGKNGLEVIEIIGNNHIDLILTDINMPEMNGIELIKKLKQVKISIPIFVTTGYTDVSLIKETKDLGIDYYFVKPLDIQELIRESLRVLN